MKFDERMKLQIKTYSTVLIIAILFYFVLLRIDMMKGWLSSIFGLLSPFIFGFVIAFLLDKPMLLIEKGLLKLKIKQKWVRTISSISALVLGVLAIIIFFALIGPQLVQSVLSLIEQAPAMIETFMKHVNEFMIENEIDSAFINQFLGEDFITNTISKITTTITNLLPRIVVAGTQITSTFINMLLGLIAGLYMMMEKENFLKACKSVVYAFARKDIADYLTRFAMITARVFNDFILGKALDSLIIGILTYVLMTFFNMPFAMLLSTIVGVTNMIPVFGPFIGAIPGIFILTIYDPIVGFYFALLILAIQQFDGNILGPIILGDRLGLPSLAVLFSVVVGGGLFGFVGMFVGVPVFAVFYIAISEVVEARLKAKNIEL